MRRLSHVAPRGSPLPVNLSATTYCTRRAWLPWAYVFSTLAAGSYGKHLTQPYDDLRRHSLPQPSWKAGPRHRGRQARALGTLQSSASLQMGTSGPRLESAGNACSPGWEQMLVWKIRKYTATRSPRDMAAATRSPPARTSVGHTGRFLPSTPARGVSGEENSPSLENCLQVNADDLEAMDDRLRCMDDHLRDMESRMDGRLQVLDVIHRGTHQPT